VSTVAGAAEPPAVPAAAAGAAPAPRPRDQQRLAVLDGWRAISILLVLATHLLPLGPKRWELNLTTGPLGMSLFFTLSGFLITQQLHARQNVAAFFVRRLFRIVPLAWAYTVVVMLLLGTGLRTWLAHLFFAINYDLPSLTVITSHFWSLCVEVHFYCFIGLLMAVTRFRGFLLLPLAWLVMFVVRAIWAPLGTIETHYRVDEILSGTCLALIYLGLLGPRPQAIIARLPFPVLVLALIVTCHPRTGTLNAFRGLAALLLVGHTLFTPDETRYSWLGQRTLRYIAEISYALYVIHPLTRYGWLGSGSTMVRYAKRIITFSLTFGLAHLSTFFFERPCTAFGKRLASRIEKRPRQPPTLDPPLLDKELSIGVQ
jgi:peptidoglycan/LPS O-acetylase OafA/YrhL